MHDIRNTIEQIRQDLKQSPGPFQEAFCKEQNSVQISCAVPVGSAFPHDALAEILLEPQPRPDLLECSFAASMPSAIEDTEGIEKSKGPENFSSETFAENGFKGGPLNATTSANKLISPMPLTCFRMYKRRRCAGFCDCSCHSKYRYQTPTLLQQFIGIAFWGYTGTPVLSASCSRTDCKSNQGRFLEINYHFPQWFISRAVHIVASISSIGNPAFGLEVRRIVAWGEEDGVLRFARTGNTGGIKSLLLAGQASHADIDPNHGFTALHVSFEHRLVFCSYIF